MEPLAGGLISDAVARDMGRVKLLAFDFDGVFTNNLVYVFQGGREAVRCSRGDGIGLSALRRSGIDTIIISTETNPIVQERARKLKTPCISGCEDKLHALSDVAEEHGLDLRHTAFVGNDINDAPCLQHVLMPIVVNDAHPDVLHLARYRTVLPGGSGAVREVCDLVIRLSVDAAAGSAP